jgi:antitoxin component YwqK of YwqJK toxin-antitoxin module
LLLIRTKYIPAGRFKLESRSANKENEDKLKKYFTKGKLKNETLPQN